MPILTDLSPDILLTEGDAATLLDSDVTVTDAEQDWDGGTLVVAGAAPSDVLGLLSGLQVVLNGSVISFNGVDIGILSTGPDGELIVTFNAQADNAAVEAVVESITFQTTGDVPDYERAITVTLTDAAGNPSIAGNALTPATVNPFAVVDFSGETARIALGDIDNDGDLDAIVSVYGDGFHLFRNDGTASAPSFVQDDAALTLTGGLYNAAGVTMVDLDGDGFEDLIVGRYGGTIQFFKGDGAFGFTEQTAAANPFDGIAVYASASPGFADLNGDGYLDMMVGTGGGRFAYFEGSASGFVAQTGGDNPLVAYRDYTGGVSVSFADVDGDGDFDMISGSGEGTAGVIENTGTSLNPVFGPFMDSPYEGDFRTGFQPVWADIDNDGDIDQIEANRDGRVDTFLSGPASPSVTVTVDSVDDVATVVDETRNDSAALGVISFNLLSNDSDVDTPLMIAQATINGAPLILDEDTPLPDGGGFLTIGSDGSVQLVRGEAVRNLGASTSGASNTSLQFVVVYTLWGGEVGTATINVAGIDDADVLDGTAGIDVILAGVGADIVNGLDGDDDLSGEAGNDRLFGGLGEDTLSGGANSDFLDGGAGADAMSGGAGDDIYIVDDGSDAVIELSSGGSDRVRANVFHQLTAQVENLQLIGSANIGGFGNELANQIDGNSGDNVLNGLAGNDLIRGAGGADELSGDDGNDQLLGGDGEDLLFGGNDNDILQGGADNDRLEGAAGLDSLDGGAGDDDLFGGAGNDKLVGGDGDDFLSGGADNDTLTGGVGADILAGGVGDDTYIVDDYSDTLVEAPLSGNDIVKATVTWTLSDHFERLILDGSGDIDGTGNGEANQITGNSGANTLDGGFGNDILNGGLGADILIGGHGADTLIGGGGSDTFLIGEVSVARSSEASFIETDAISDYAIGLDIIDLSAIDAIASTSGIDDSFSIVSAFNGEAGQLVLTFSGGITTLQLDVDGDGKADYRLRINGDVRADTSDWLL